MKYAYNNPEQQFRRKGLRTRQTAAESVLWNQLRKKQVHGVRFWRQYGVGVFILDFYCPQLRLAIEVDGGQHNTEEGRENDMNRTLFLKERAIDVIRFWNNDVLSALDSVMEVISRTVYSRL